MLVCDLDVITTYDESVLCLTPTHHILQNIMYNSHTTVTVSIGCVTAQIIWQYI